MSCVDLRLVDELCLEMRQYAETIEKLIAGNGAHKADINSSMTEIVFETRKQLAELTGAKNNTCLGERRTATIRDLARKYEELEGILKEIRNDIEQKATIIDNAHCRCRSEADKRQ